MPTPYRSHNSEACPSTWARGDPDATGETYDCPICGYDLTEEIDRIDVAGWGDGAFGTLPCPMCQSHLEVYVELVRSLTVKAWKEV